MLVETSLQSKMVMCRYGCNRRVILQHRQPIAVKRKPIAACNDCGKTFLSLNALRQHQLSEEGHISPWNGIRLVGCEKCNRIFRSQDALEQHFVADHSLIILAYGNRMQVQLEAEFTANWRKPSPPGRVLSVFKIYNPGWRTLEFELYKQRLPKNGNQVRGYHGTTLLCDLGNNKNSKLCQSAHCNLCNILRTGFKMTKARDDTFQRFGKGIYTTATSGKSHDYSHTPSSRKAVLVCRILAGKVYRTRTDIPTLESPPEGYNSVYGEVGERLNYDELVVYSSKAILPDYMIVYEA